MSGWVVEYRRRWRFWPTWAPFGRRRVTYYVSGGDFVYGD